jgi:hypothetical protein
VANKALRPGGPIGVEAVLREQFGVPPKPDIGFEAAAQAVRDAIARGAISCQRLEVSDRPVRRGALFDMSGARVPFPAGKEYERSYVALVDPDVEAQWAHSAHWAFVPAEGNGDVVLQDTRFAAHMKGAARFFTVPLR